jgi:hypothetical protein
VPKGSQLHFDLVVEEDFPIKQIEILKAILEEGGRRMGIGDYRPQKKGRFGKFKVVSWEEQANGNGTK